VANLLNNTVDYSKIPVTIISFYLLKSNGIERLSLLLLVFGSSVFGSLWLLQMKTKLCKIVSEKVGH
jgi:hypothetical protein